MRSTSTSSRTLPLLLAAGALASLVAVSAWFSRADAPSRRAAAAHAGAGEAGTSADDVERGRSLASGEFAARSESAPRASPATAPTSDIPELARSVRPSGGSSERELVDGFLARERAEPGSLARDAREILDGDAPLARRVAFLRALDELSAPTLVDELARAAVGDAQRSQPALADFAVRTLARRARADERASAALRELAFGASRRAIDGERRAADDVCRRAACAWAELASGPRALRELEQACRLEDDDLLVRGVLSTLQDRARAHPSDERELLDLCAALALRFPPHTAAAASDAAPTEPESR